MKDYKDLLNDPLTAEILKNPQIQKMQKELQDFVDSEYAVFDAKIFVGETAGLVKAYYCFGQKGFINIEVDNTLYSDQKFVCSMIPLACNDALLKYAKESKIVGDKIINKQNEVLSKMVSFIENQATIKPAATTPTVPNANLFNNKKKEYLN